MPLLIDTFNVLHTTGVLPPELSGIDVLGLIGLLQRSRYAGERVTLACDGSPQVTIQDTGTIGLVEEVDGLDGYTIRHSGPRKTADDLIIELIKVNTAPRRLIVVSSDNQILRAARKRRCKVFSSPEFLQQLADDARLPRPNNSSLPKPRTAMTDQQVARWMNIFKLDAAEPALPEAPPLPPEMQDHLLDEDESTERDQTDVVTDDLDADEALDDEPSPEELALREKIAKGLPLSLIEQAEQLVQEHERTHRAVRAAPAAPVAPLAPPATAASKPTGRAPALPIDHSRIDAIDPEQIDMNTILPQDGRTRRLKPKPRHQPPRPT